MLPLIASEFDVESATAALGVSATTIGLAATVIPWSTVGDHIGRVLAHGDRCALRAVICVASAILFLARPTRSRVRVAAAPRPSKPSLPHRLAENLRSPRRLTLYAQGLLLMGSFVVLYNYLGIRLTEPPSSLPHAIVGLLFLS